MKALVLNVLLMYMVMCLNFRPGKLIMNLFIFLPMINKKGYLC